MNQDKKELRKQMKKVRSDLPEEYKEAADQKIAERLWQTKEYQEARLIFCYVSMKDEVDTRSILEQALSDGKRVAVPVCRGRGLMEAWEIKSLSELSPGAYGILEPTQPLSVNPKEIDLCLVPCLACDRAGRRLGYGGGYYDRYLKLVDENDRNGSKEYRATILCLCRLRQILQGVPAEEHDVWMDGILMEEGIIYCSKLLKSVTF